MEFEAADCLYMSHIICVNLCQLCDSLKSSQPEPLCYTLSALVFGDNKCNLAQQQGSWTHHSTHCMLRTTGLQELSLDVSLDVNSCTTIGHLCKKYFGTHTFQIQFGSSATTQSPAQVCVALMCTCHHEYMYTVAIIALQAAQGACCYCDI